MVGSLHARPKSPRGERRAFGQPRAPLVSRAGSASRGGWVCARPLSRASAKPRVRYVARARYVARVRLLVDPAQRFALVAQGGLAAQHLQALRA
jgi:hypothetical protein